ncbi:MAG TPA: HEAT repeat domain-containing protein [Planctomycetota bacterium]
MGPRGSIPVAMVAIVLAAAWTAAEPGQPPAPSPVATPPPTAAVADRLPPPPATRTSGAFVAEPQSMADVHRLREQTAAATADALPDLRTLALTARDPIAVGCALEALARLGALPGDQQVAALAHDPRPRVRQQFALALGQCGEAAVPRLLAMGNGDDAAVRSLAILALGRIGGRDALAALATIAQADDLDVPTRARLQAARQRAADPGLGRRIGR